MYVPFKYSLLSWGLDVIYFVEFEKKLLFKINSILSGIDCCAISWV